MTEAVHSMDGAHAEAAHEHYDPMGVKIGMWLFLFTEVMLFGAFFIAFAVYFTTYTIDFRTGSALLHRDIGAINTVVLLTSSLTIALSIAALERGDRKKAMLLMGTTVAFALLFLVFKSIEWGEKLEHHIYPGSEVMVTNPPGLQVFYGLYFAMTGLHALHVIIGGLAIVAAMVRLRAGKITRDRPLFLVNVGLYWHLVDLVWIYLFPLFYLMH